MVPYIDPKRFNRQNNKAYSLSEKSDVYSVGVLLWEISSGKPPFYNEGEQNGIGLVLEISQGLRETPVPNTPKEYETIIYPHYWPQIIE
jgi:serine/threonine protein kinase